MIKCQVEVCAKIKRSAVVKTDNEGSTFLSFSVVLPIKGYKGTKKDLEIGVTLDGGNAEKSVYVEKRRVRMKGTMYIRKSGGVTYYNLRADETCEIVQTSESDEVSGTMEFKGKTSGKEVEEHTDKRGKAFKVFSAFSSDKNGEKVEFTWVRFVYFNPKNEIIPPKSYVHVSGDLQLGVYKDEITIECKVSEVSGWELEKK